MNCTCLVSDKGSRNHHHSSWMHGWASSTTNSSPAPAPHNRFKLLRKVSSLSSPFPSVDWRAYGPLPHPRTTLNPSTPHPNSYSHLGKKK